MKTRPLVEVHLLPLKKKTQLHYFKMQANKNLFFFVASTF